MQAEEASTASAAAANADELGDDSSQQPPIGVAIFGFSPAAACAIHQLLHRRRQQQQQPRHHRDAAAGRRELRLVGCWTADAAERTALADFLAAGDFGADFADVSVGGDPAELAARSDVSVLLLCCRCQRVQTSLARLAAETGSLAVRLSTPPPPPHTVPDNVAVGCSYRFLAPVRRMKACLAEGLIGRLHAVRVALRCPSLVGPRYDWSWDPSMGAGVLAHYGALAVDLVQFLLPPQAASPARPSSSSSAADVDGGGGGVGSEGQLVVTRASGHLRTCLSRGGDQKIGGGGIRRVGVDQLAEFDLQLAGDCWVHAWLDSLASGYSHTVELIGERGRLTLDDFVLSHAPSAGDASSAEAPVPHSSDPLTDAERQLMELIAGVPEMPMRQFLSPALVKCVSGLIESIARQEAILDSPAAGYWGQLQRTLVAVRLSNQLRRCVSLVECEAGRVTPTW